MSNTINLIKNYKQYKSKEELIKAKIEMLKELLTLNDLSDFYCKKQIYKKPLISRPTEAQAISNTDEKNKNKCDKLAREEIAIEINDLKSRLFAIKYKINSIEIAMEYLNREEKYIIECIFLYKINYNNLLINLQSNKEFKNKKVWCKNTIINIKNNAIDKMDQIISPDLAINYNYAIENG